MSVTRPQIAAEARTLLGVRFRHQGRDPQTGLDCLGLVEVVAHRLFGREIMTPDYPRRPPADRLRAGLEKECAEIETAEAREGDVLLINLPKDDAARHVGILAAGPYELMIVHACEFRERGRVVEEPYRGWLRRNTVAAFRFPEGGY